MNTHKWPDGKQAAAWFSFDLDGESWLLGADLRNAELPVTMSQAAYGPKVGVFLILDLLARYEVSATFFVPSWTAERYPRTVAAIVDGGHEIALHGHMHELPLELSSADQAAILARSKEILTRLTGKPPVGYRPPGGEVTTSTIEVLADAGVLYCSGFMDALTPYFHEVSGNAAMVELPVHWVCDDWGYSMVSPFARPTPQVNAIMTNDHVIELWTAELNAIVALGGLFTLVNHPQVTGRPYRLATLEAILAKVTEDSAIWVGTGRHIADYWRGEHVWHSASIK